MKTLVVLSALASIAIAAPSFLAKDYPSTLPENWPEYTRRDKKSPQGYFYAESAPLTVGVPPVHVEAELDGSSPTGRSFGLSKKPLTTPTIIQRPSGYHVYRDSAEERAQADPNENCSKQVKFKFCKSENTGRSTHEDDMESSIKMAKEAIEHLQRDLKNIEHGSKSASWNDRDLMHEDIEVARKALDHVHKNFGNLDSMSLHSTLVDANPSQQINDDSHQMHEERASQWKEHIETFKSNEGARNIEDTIKPTDHHESSVHIENIDATKLMKNSEKTENLLHEEPLKETIEDIKETNERHANIEINTLPDMKVSETKIEPTHHLTDEKSAEVNKDKSNNVLEEKNIEHEHLKAKASDLLTSNAQAVNGADHSKTHIDDKLRASNDHHQIEINNPATEGHLTEPASVQHLEKNENNEHFRKSSEHEWNHETEKHLKQPKNSFIETQSMHHPDVEMKNKHMKQEIEESQEKKAKENKFDNLETSMKSAEHENAKEMLTEHHEEHKDDKLTTPTHISSEKSAVSMEKTDSEQNHNMGRWAPVTNEQIEKNKQMKAATDFHNHHSQSMTHHWDPTVGSSNHMDTKMHPFHEKHMKVHEHQHFMKHGKSADDFNGIASPNLKTSMTMDHAKSADFDGFMVPSLPSNLIDFAGKSAMDMMQWSHKADGGRSAYGGYGGSGLSGGSISGGGLSGGSAPGGGAVGVFPNARVGGCAVPLLLSCSPSVVSGSLAKSGYGSGYGSAPAYRSVDEFNFHNKRDTKKFKDIKKNIKQRTTILDKKL